MRDHRAVSALAATVVLACAPQESPAPPERPPLGGWPLQTIDGTIQVRHGGSPVICRSGLVEYLPAPLFDDEVPMPSSVVLTPDSFEFELVFDQDGYYDRYSNGPAATDSFRGRWHERPAGLRTEGSWNWEERTVRGAVATGSSPRRDLRPSSDLDPLPDDAVFEEPWLSFEVSGRFAGPTELAGEWHYRELTRLGGCWSAGRGSGTWSAIAPISDETSSRR